MEQIPGTTSAALEARLARLEQANEEKDELISDLQNRITELELTAIGSGESVEYYPDGDF